MELFGLVSIVDSHIFGDLASFREQFMRLGSTGQSEAARNASLRERISPLLTRTLRANKCSSTSDLRSASR